MVSDSSDHVVCEQNRAPSNELVLCSMVRQAERIPDPPEDQVPGAESVREKVDGRGSEWKGSTTKSIAGGVVSRPTHVVH